MPANQATPRRIYEARGDAQLVRYEQYIDNQVETTRRLVKLVDLATSLVVLAAGILAFLLAAAVVEHWLVPGGYPLAARVALFALLIAGVTYFAYRRLWPLCIRAINPVYAAQTIERNGPSLKNTLVNFLLLRQRRGEISEAVYRTLEEQAAQRLIRVPTEGAVDRSLLIRFGYVLLAVVAVAALYKVFSPKDPLVSAQRVLMPWADVMPPSRVQIVAVEPGNVTVSRGEFVNISAEVRGIGDDEPVFARYTTVDGRAVNKPIPMTVDESGLRFTTRLPEAGASVGEVGAAQNFTYRIEAGDARSLDYSVTVVPAPAILVERVQYEYPAYTGYSNQQTEGLGDIRAIEGTRVTITARANGPIREAHVDFDADGRRDLRMTTSDTTATASFVLALREDRRTPKHASYVLRLINRDGRTNRDPVKHSITVEPDLSPETSILLPQEKVLDVRLDETVAIEVEARDPDFALSSVRLRGEVAGRVVIDQPLLEGEHRGRFTARYSFTPSAHHLSAGDVVQYWAIAHDNRTPEPNVVESERKSLRIVSPDPPKHPDQIVRRDAQQRQQPGEQQPNQQQQPGQQGGATQEGQPGAQGSGAAGQPQDQAGEQQKSRQDQPQGSQGEQPSSSDEAHNQPGQQATSPREGEQTTSGEKNGGQPQQRSPGEQPQDQPRGEQTPGAAGSKPGSRQPSEPSGNGQQPSAGGQPGNAPPNAGERPNDATKPSPVSPEGDHDAEAFGRIRRHLERSGQLKSDESATQEDSPLNRDAQQSAEHRQENTPRDPASSSPKDSPSSGATERKESPTRDEATKPAQRVEQPGVGPGAETKGDDVQRPEQPKDGDEARQKQEATESPGGKQTSSKGPAGAGAEQRPQGAPDSQPQLKPAEKRPQPTVTQNQPDATEPPAGARGKKESDSRGEQGGDRAGGGEEGGGQKAPREGTGSAGQNQSAEEGAGETDEKGTGTDSRAAGKDATANQQTGESSGKTPGEGSTTRQGDRPLADGKRQAADQPSAAEGVGDSPRATPHEDQQPLSRDAQRNPAEQQSDKRNGKQAPEKSQQEGELPTDTKTQGEPGQSGAPTGAGTPGGTTATATPQTEGTAPEADPANLEYARKQTDLVLEKLADQLRRKQVDEQLLEELGWSEEDLRKFVARWRARKEAAQREDAAGEAARRELDEALRSLGLRRGPLQQRAVRQDTLRDLREGYRGPVPPEFQERLRAYNRGVSRAREIDKE